MRRTSNPYQMKTFKLDKFKEFSELLLDIVISLNKKEKFDVKFSEIFIDINNSLNDIYTSGEYKSYSTSIFLLNFDKLLMNFRIKLDSKVENTFEIMDECIAFKFLYYEMVNLFPRGILMATLSLDDSDAEAWWIRNFDDMLFVPKDKFIKCLCQCFFYEINGDNLLKSLTLKNDVTLIEFIGKSCFNLFLRFYGGWINFSEFWPQIHCHPAYMGTISSEHAEQKLIEIKNCLLHNRSSEKSYIFFINWRCDTGLWNVISIEDDKLINRLTDSKDLLQVISNERLYKYPKGEEYNNTVPDFHSLSISHDSHYDNLYSVSEYANMTPTREMSPDDDQDAFQNDNQDAFQNMNPTREMSTDDHKDAFQSLLPPPMD